MKGVLNYVVFTVHPPIYLEKETRKDCIFGEEMKEFTWCMGFPCLPCLFRFAVAFKTYFANCLVQFFARESRRKENGKNKKGCIKCCNKLTLGRKREVLFFSCSRYP